MAPRLKTRRRNGKVEYFDPKTRTWKATTKMDTTTKYRPVKKDEKVDASGGKIKVRPKTKEEIRKGKGIKIQLDGGGTKTIYPGHKDYESAKSGKKKISTKPSDHAFGGMKGVQEPKKNKVKIKSNGNGKGKPKDDGGRADWLDKTKRSPAAKAGFNKDERWALQQKHRKWKAARKAGTLGDWEKEHAPNRTPRYKNKLKIEKKKKGGK
jgi:hypothetical protein